MYLTMDSAERIQKIMDHVLTKIDLAAVHDAPDEAIRYLSVYEQLLRFLDECDVELRLVEPKEDE